MSTKIEHQQAETDKSSTINSITLFLDELETLNRAANKWAARHGYPLVEDYPQYPRARQIGSAFFEMGGFSGMQEACHLIRHRMAKTPRTKQDIQLVEYGWAGIGGWAS